MNVRAVRMSKVMEAGRVAADVELEEAFTVQQAAQLTGLSEHTLRYYERVGLLPPVRRQDSSRHEGAAEIARELSRHIRSHHRGE
jgi:MerR-like DNA binding protein